MSGHIARGCRVNALLHLCCNIELSLARARLGAVFSRARVPSFIDGTIMSREIFAFGLSLETPLAPLQRSPRVRLHLSDDSVGKAAGECFVPEFEVDWEGVAGAPCRYGCI